MDDKGKSIVARRPRIFLLAISAIYAAAAAADLVLDRFRSRPEKRRKRRRKKKEIKEMEKPFIATVHYKYVPAE